MKRKQARFTSERSIHADINNTLREIAASHIEANDMEAKGREYIRTGNHELVEAGTDLVKKAAGIRENRIQRLDNKLEKLKQALSAFKTELLPGISGDKGVVLENLK